MGFQLRVISNVAVLYLQHEIAILHHWFGFHYICCIHRKRGTQREVRRQMSGLHEKCRRICAYEKRCAAYTWHENGSCHLKKKLTSKTWKKKVCGQCQSGHFLSAKKIKYMKGINLAGGDLEC